MADRATLILLAGYLAGAGLLAYELQPTPPLAPPSPEQTVHAPPPVELPPIAINNVAIYDAIIERPLFSPDRRQEDESDTPVASPAPQRVAAAEGIDGFRLAAVMKEPGSVTVLIENPSGETLALHQGDKLGSWQIEEILDDRVVIVSDTRRETLMVYRFDPVVERQRPKPAPDMLRRRLLQVPSRRPPGADRAPSNPPVKP